MKRILIVINILLLLVILFLLSWFWKEKKTVAIVKDNTPSSCVECKDYSGDPFTGIKLETAREMAALYKTNHYELYTAAKGTNDALSVWFSLDTLKKFIWTIEHNLCKQDCGNQLNLGIRIYYAEYPADLGTGAAGSRNADYRSVKNTYGGKHTVFMVPTYNDKGFDWDFNPLATLATGCKPQPLTEYINSYMDIQKSNNRKDSSLMKQHAIIMFAGSNSNGAVQNHGNMIPPDNPTGTAF